MTDCQAGCDGAGRKAHAVLQGFEGQQELDSESEAPGRKMNQNPASGKNDVE